MICEREYLVQDNAKAPKISLVDRISFKVKYLRGSIDGTAREVFARGVGASGKAKVYGRMGERPAYVCGIMRRVPMSVT